MGWNYKSKGIFLNILNMNSIINFYAVAKTDASGGQKTRY